MPVKATLWLVGMMGAGKSTVGPALARRLGRPYVDADLEIVRQAGCSIPEIFQREGEAGFRSREREAVAALAGRKLVVSLGGGAMVQSGVAEQLQASGHVVYLRARCETLLERVGEDEERPLLAGLDRAGRLDRLRTLLAEREEHYLTASLVVDTDEAEPEALAELIVKELGEEGA